MGSRSVLLVSVGGARSVDAPLPEASPTEIASGLGSLITVIADTIGGGSNAKKAEEQAAADRARAAAQKQQSLTTLLLLAAAAVAAYFVLKK